MKQGAPTKASALTAAARLIIRQWSTLCVLEMDKDFTESLAIEKASKLTVFLLTLGELPELRRLPVEGAGS